MSRIALVHDYFIQMGGAERVAEEFQAIFPDAPMFTTVDQRIGTRIPRSAARTSWMQQFPITKQNHRNYFLLYPFAVESLDLSEYDVILSSTSGYAKGVRKKPGAVHVCYCHTPMRWVWKYEQYAKREEFGSLKRALLPYLIKGLKRWDIRAAKSPDHYIANSRYVADLIRKYYDREAAVIPPPIDVNRFRPRASHEDFYLLLSRLAPYKRLDLAVRACKKLNRRLVVIGDGVARGQLEELAGPRTTFMGQQPDEVVNDFASRCRALIFPGEEDFGMTPLEVNAAGRPVIAYFGGGASETVIENVTGKFFKSQDVKSLVAAIEAFESQEWDGKRIRAHAESFDKEVFRRRIVSFLEHLSPEIESAPEIAGGGMRTASGHQV